MRSLRILGDITDAKDNHSASLVNQVVSSFHALHSDDILIIPGNHDWLLKDQVFFRFLGLMPHIKFATVPTEDVTMGYKEQCIFLPFSKNPAADWKGIEFADFDYAFMHQTVQGSRASNGQVMEGEGVPLMPVRKRVYSGDIHVPQTIGNVTYIGSPYHVHFGDDFEPRVLLLDKGGKETWLRFPAPRRIVLRVGSLKELGRKLHDLEAGDQIKLRMVLPASEKHAWSRIKREAAAMLNDGDALVVHGIEMVLDREAGAIEEVRAEELKRLTPQELLLRYVEREELGAAAYDAGMDVLEAK